MTFGRAAVLQAGYAACSPATGSRWWNPPPADALDPQGHAGADPAYGDARYLVVVETDSNRKPISVKVLRAWTACRSKGARIRARVLATAKSFQLLGRTALISEGTGDKPRVLRLYDLGTGKDVWRKEYDAKAIPIKSPSQRVGRFRPARRRRRDRREDGKVAATLRIDEKNLETDLKPAGRPGCSPTRTGITCSSTARRGWLHRPRLACPRPQQHADDHAGERPAVRLRPRDGQAALDFRQRALREPGARPGSVRGNARDHRGFPDADGRKRVNRTYPVVVSRRPRADHLRTQHPLQPQLLPQPFRESEERHDRPEPAGQRANRRLPGRQPAGDAV